MANINELEQKLFEKTLRKIRSQWKIRKDIRQFTRMAQQELWTICREFREETAKITSELIKVRLYDAAEKLQLTITAKLERPYTGKVSGIGVEVSHHGKSYAIIYIGPVDGWDKIMYLPPHKRYGQENPFTKKRLRSWNVISDYDFNSLLLEIKEAIDHPPPPEDPDEEDETPF